MKRLIQSGFLAAYRLLRGIGFLDTGFGRRVFIVAYDQYKQRFEATAAAALRLRVVPGTTVVDVGANIGFFTVRIAEWVGSSGLVVAIESELKNLDILRERIRKAGIESSVQIVEGVAAESSGELLLTLNPHHPADHRIGNEGVTVRSWTIDEILESHGCPVMSLIKVDVQGAEPRVLQGRAGLRSDVILRCMSRSTMTHSRGRVFRPD